MKKLKTSRNAQIPSPRANAFLCTHKNQGFLLGGASRTAEFSDIWALSLESGEICWTSLQKSLKKPLPSRVGTAFCQVNGEVFLHGGQNFLENQHFEDFYRVNLETLEIAEISRKNAKIWPDRRNSHTMVFEEKGRKLIIFGGADEEGPLDSIFAFSLEKEEWTEIPNKFQGLKAREMHTSHVFYSENAEFLARFAGKCEKTQEKQEKPQGNPEKTEKTQGIAEETQQNPENPQKIVEISFDIPEDPSETHSFPLEIPAKVAKTELKFEEEHKNPENPSFSPDQTPFPGSAYLLIIGGRTCEGISNEIFALNLEKNALFLLRKLPHGLCAHGSFLRNDELFLYGGTDGLGFLNILYNYRINSDVLLKVPLDDEIKGFEARISPALASFSGEELVIFGGSGFEEEKNEVLLVKVGEVAFKPLI